MLHALALLALACPQDAPDAVDAHSEHGAAFDIGPRQAATLMEHPDRIDFPVTLAPGKEHLQAFMLQGIGQLHGFWFLEAERTFRQILSEDPDCAMASWGLALANVDHPDRAAWFARAAWLKRGLVTDREQRYIDMIARYYRVEGPDEPEDLQEPKNPAPGEGGTGEGGTGEGGLARSRAESASFPSARSPPSARRSGWSRTTRT